MNVDDYRYRMEMDAARSRWRRWLKKLFGWMK